MNENNGNLMNIAEDSARGSFFLFSGAAISSIILAIATILLGRLLGPDMYGQYSLILVIPSFLYLFTDLGVNAGITKYTASLRAQGKKSQVFSVIYNGLFFRLGMGIALTIACIIFASYFALLINRSDLNFWIQFVGITVALQVVYTTANSVFVGMDKTEFNAILTNAQALTKAGAQIALVFLGFGLGGALIGYVGGTAMGAAIAIILLYKFLKQKKPISKNLETNQTRKNVLDLLVRYGMPVYVAVVLTGFFGLYMQMVLSFFVSDAAIGNFRAAYNFVSLMIILTTSIKTALIPAFSKLELQTTDNINKFSRLSNKYISLIVVPCAVLVIIFANTIIKLVYGSMYTSAGLFLQVNIIVYLFVGFGYLWLTSLFNGIGKTRLTMYSTLINFIILLILAPLLASTSGVLGVIIAYVISALASALYSMFAAKRQLKVNLDLKLNLLILLLAGFSAIPPLLIVAVFPSLNSAVSLILGIVTYTVTYLTLIPLFGAMKESELKMLCKTTAKTPLLNVLTKIIAKYEKLIIKLKQKAKGNKTKLKK
jgi:O-antigen/teichoic acid export membrane protein